MKFVSLAQLRSFFERSIFFNKKIMQKIGMLKNWNIEKLKHGKSNFSIFPFSIFPYLLVL